MEKKLLKSTQVDRELHGVQKWCEKWEDRTMEACLELQRGQVSYKKIRRRNRVKQKIGGYYKDEENNDTR